MVRLSLNSPAYRAARSYWWTNVHKPWWKIPESEQKTMSAWLADQGARIVSCDQPEPEWLAELSDLAQGMITQGMKSLDVAGFSPGYDYLVFDQAELATAFLLKWG